MARLRQEQRAKKRRRLVLLLFGLALVFAGGAGMLKMYLEDKAAAAMTGRMQSFVLRDSDAAATDTPEAFSVKGTVTANSSPLVDFEGLQKEAPEAIAWLFVPACGISQPVVQAEDNSFYLTHGANRTQSRAGAIFLDTWCDPSFSGANSILYGHRMNDGSMFAPLHSLKDQNVLSSDPSLVLVLPDGRTFSYEIFAVRAVSAGLAADPYRISFSGPEDIRDWVQSPTDGVLASREIPSDAEQPAHILTLSTCMKGRPEDRLVVQAIRVTAP